MLIETYVNGNDKFKVSAINDAYKNRGPQGATFANMQDIIKEDEGRDR